MVPVALLTAAAVQLLCQLYKVVFHSIRDRTLRLRYFISAGGMPSAHSAFVTALATAIGIRAGVGSEVFSVAAVFGIIVIYDSLRLRRTVQGHSELLNRLVRKYHAEEKANQSEMVGHTIPEVLAGMVVGGGLSAVVSRLLIRAFG